MIVREIETGGLMLIPQTDHSRLVGQIAAHWGNDRFAAPTPYDTVARAAAFHDYGWLRYETSPQFNEETGETYEFRKAPPTQLLLEGYEWCSDWLMQPDPYAALMVSRHRTGLWHGRYGTMQHPAHPYLRNLPDPIEAYLEKHEARQEKDLNTVPRPEFDVNYHLLQIWDLLGLYFCCQEPYEDYLDPVPTDYSNDPAHHVRMTMTPITDRKIRFDPYPFEVPGLRIQLARRLLANARWDSAEDFRRDYFKSELELVEFELV